MSEKILCPVLDCEWSLDSTPPQVGPEVLAGVFGPGVMAATALHQHHYRIERELERHLGGHKPVDFVRTITRLRQERDEALNALSYVSSGAGA